jgi:hypothetical protein
VKGAPNEASSEAKRRQAAADQSDAGPAHSRELRFWDERSEEIRRGWANGISQSKPCCALNDPSFPRGGMCYYRHSNPNPFYFQWIKKIDE